MSNRVDFDAYTSDYNRLLSESTRFFSASEEYFARYKVAIMKQRVGAPVARLLEYGCGIGRNIPYLREAFPHASITGSDISVASLDLARTANPDATFVPEGPAVDAAGPFDAIMVAGVFHHVPLAERTSVAQTLRNRLDTGGVVFVFEHNPYNPVTRRIVSNCPYDEDAVLLKPAELRRLLSGAGLSVQHQSYCLFVPPRFGRLAACEAALGWLPFGGQYWIEARRRR